MFLTVHHKKITFHVMHIKKNQVFFNYVSYVSVLFVYRPLKDKFCEFVGVNGTFFSLGCSKDRPHVGNTNTTHHKKLTCFV